MKVGGRERQTAGGDERSGWWVVRGREESSRRYKSDVDVGVRVDSGIDVPQCSVGRGRCSLAASECRERGIQTNEGLRGKRQGGDGKKAGGNSGEIERGRGVERARGQEGFQFETNDDQRYQGRAQLRVSTPRIKKGGTKPN